MDQNALKIGLTGGIGCGKSTVADRFAALGAAVIDTDHIAHHLTRPPSAAKRPVSMYAESRVRSTGTPLRNAARRLLPIA
ncbi:MAG: dephospho-CoA kinase [Burkholderiaceae bacterium]|nr:dephospho-CoA kinase [Burkholderiaceae bacterium]